MPHSMTGFGRAEDHHRGIRLRCEIRSVNHRYLSLKLRLPPILMRFEPWVDAMIRKRLSRGSVDLYVGYQALSEAATSHLDEQVADLYRRQLTGYLKRRKLGTDLSPEFLFGLPGVMMPPDPGSLATTIQPRLRKLLAEALDEMVEMRQREGGRLATVLRRELKSLATCSSRIQKVAPRIVRDARKRLKERVDALLADEGGRLDPGTLAREVALLADKSDVTEELDRLDSHRAEFESRLNAKRPIGRSLDFLVQELGREVNTVGSKVQDTTALSHVLKAKAIVEKLREQVQNLE